MVLLSLKLICFNYENSEYPDGMSRLLKIKTIIKRYPKRKVVYVVIHVHANFIIGSYIISTCFFYEALTNIDFISSIETYSLSIQKASPRFYLSYTILCSLTFNDYNCQYYNFLEAVS